MKRAGSGTGRPEYSRTSQLREWVGIGLGILGTIMAILGYQEAVKSRERSSRVEAYVYLDTAWDLMGGRPGSTIILTPMKDPTKLEEARRSIERALVLEPESGRAYRIRGSYLRTAGRIPEAISSLEKAVTLDPEDPRSHTALGILCIDTGNYSKAKVELVEAARLEPRDYNIYANLGVLSIKQDKVDDAITYYGQAINLAPEYEAVYNLKGSALRKLGREGEALLCFARAAELRNQFALADKLTKAGRVNWAKTHNNTSVPDCRHRG